MDDDDSRTPMLGEGDHDSTTLQSSRTQHQLTKSEMVQGMANRFMYSKFYIGLYLVLAILSFITIIMSLNEPCTSTLFIIFEATINFAMIIEVTTRLLALGKTYWASAWNIVDIVLVVLCIITLIVLTTGCSASERNEALFDTILLVIRNGVQFFRLFMMLRRNQYSIHARATRVDFDDIESNDRESVEFTALDRDRGLDESFLDDEDSDIEQNRI